MDGNRIYPFKKRTIDYKKPVYIYRNLHSKDVRYSIRQDGLVVAHTDCIGIVNVEFVVNQKGRERVRKEKRKNVHAFIKGHIAVQGLYGTTAERDEQLGRKFGSRISYNPYGEFGFYTEDLTIYREEISGGGGVVINKQGVFGTYLNFTYNRKVLDKFKHLV